MFGTSQYDFQMLAYASKVRARVGMMRDDPKQFVPDVDWDVGMPCHCIACTMRAAIPKPYGSILFGSRYHYPR